MNHSDQSENMPVWATEVKKYEKSLKEHELLSDETYNAWVKQCKSIVQLATNKK